MDNQTPRQRPKQVFPDQQPRYEETQYEQPRYVPQYQEPYYEPYAPPAPEPQQRDNVPAIILGVLFAIAAVAATVLFFLWRGAAVEANKPPVTVTQTQTQMVTTTETTTKRPSIFGRDETAATAPREPSPQDPPQPPSFELPQDVRDALNDLRDEAESIFQGQ